MSVGLVHTPSGRQLAAGGKKRRRYMGRSALYAKSRVEAILKDLTADSVHIAGNVGGDEPIPNVGRKKRKPTFSIAYLAKFASDQPRDKKGRWTKAVATDALHAHLFGLLTDTAVPKGVRLGGRVKATRDAAVAAGKSGGKGEAKVSIASGVSQLLSRRAMEMKPGPRADWLRRKLQEHGVLTEGGHKFPGRTLDYGPALPAPKGTTPYHGVFAGYRATRPTPLTNEDRKKRDLTRADKIDEMAAQHERYAAMRATWKQPEAAAMYAQSAQRLREQAQRHRRLAEEWVSQPKVSQGIGEAKRSFLGSHTWQASAARPFNAQQVRMEVKRVRRRETLDRLREEGRQPWPTMQKKANARQKAKVKATMDEWKAGTLHSGSKHGPTVTNQKQAIAIALSQAGLSKMNTWVIEKAKKALKDKKIMKDDEIGNGGNMPANPLTDSARAPAQIPTGIDSSPEEKLMNNGNFFSTLLNGGPGAALGKRSFSAARRRRDAKSGKAMRGGRYPIEGDQDVRNAVRDAARTRAGSAVRAHIASRARALGDTQDVPWLRKYIKGAVAKAVSFDRSYSPVPRGPKLAKTSDKDNNTSSSRTSLSTLTSIGSVADDIVPAAVRGIKGGLFAASAV